MYNRLRQLPGKEFVWIVRQAWEKARLTYRVSMGRHQAITRLRNWRDAQAPQLASQVWARPFFRQLTQPVLQNSRILRLTLNGEKGD